METLLLSATNPPNNRRQKNGGDIVVLYKKLLKDHLSSDEQVKERLEYLETFCRNIIRLELEKHDRQAKRRQA
jgi:hypothetical protein